MPRALDELFIIVGAPPERDKTVILGLLQHQKTADAALRTYKAAKRPDAPDDDGWIIRAAPMYPITELDWAMGQFFIDAGQPPGSSIIDPLVQHFRDELSTAFEKAIFGMPPIAESKWGKRR